MRNFNTVELNGGSDLDIASNMSTRGVLCDIRVPCRLKGHSRSQSDLQCHMKLNVGQRKGE